MSERSEGACRRARPGAWHRRSGRRSPSPGRPGGRHAARRRTARTCRSPVELLDVEVDRAATRQADGERLVVGVAERHDARRRARRRAWRAPRRRRHLRRIRRSRCRRPRRTRSPPSPRRAAAGPEPSTSTTRATAIRWPAWCHRSMSSSSSRIGVRPFSPVIAVASRGVIGCVTVRRSPGRVRPSPRSSGLPRIGQHTAGRPPFPVPAARTRG